VIFEIKTIVLYCAVQAVNCLPNLEELYLSSNRIQRLDSLAKCKKVSTRV